MIIEGKFLPDPVIDFRIDPDDPTSELDQPADSDLMGQLTRFNRIMRALAAATSQNSGRFPRIVVTVGDNWQLVTRKSPHSDSFSPHHTLITEGLSHRNLSQGLLDIVRTTIGHLIVKPQLALINLASEIA